MKKHKFDLELFWSLPTCLGDLSAGNGAYCAVGAAYKALGESKVDSRECNIRWSLSPCMILGVDLGDAFEVNDNGDTEKAKRLVLNRLIASGKIKFTEDPRIFKVSKEAIINV